MGQVFAEEYLKKRYAETENNKAIDLTATNRERIQQYLHLKEQLSELQSQEKELENQIKHEMKDAEYGFIGNYQAYWKPVVSNRVDTKKLKEQFPDIYEEVKKETHFRRFRIKEVS